MKQTKRLKELIESGISIKFLAKTLCISPPTLYKRMKDHKYSEMQKDKINSFSL